MFLGRNMKYEESERGRLGGIGTLYCRVERSDWTRQEVARKVFFVNSGTYRHCNSGKYRFIQSYIHCPSGFAEEDLHCATTR